MTEEQRKAFASVNTDNNGNHYLQLDFGDDTGIALHASHLIKRKSLETVAEKVNEHAAQVAQRTEDSTGFSSLIADAVEEAENAMKKYPQPNYVITKIAEEAGEVVKSCVHCAEGRDTKENLRGEMKQLIAMLYRLWVEGDQVHGLSPVNENEALRGYERANEEKQT